MRAFPALFLLSACTEPPPEGGDFEARLAALEEELETVQGDLAAAQARLDACVAADDLEGYATTEWVEEQGYASAGEVEQLATAVEGARVDVDTTLAVPADYATIAEALAALDHVTIAGDATVTVLVASGTYTLTEPIVVRHPQGDRIAIVGDGLGAELDFVGTDGIQVTMGSVLGRLDNLILAGDGTEETRGVYVADNGVVELGPTLHVQGFGHGVVADIGGVARATPAGDAAEGWEGVTSSDNTFWGFYAGNGGIVYAPYAVASGNVYGGFAAVYGGGLAARDSRSAASAAGANYGYLATIGAWMDVQSAESEGATSVAGFGASDGAVVEADGVTVSGTSTYALFVRSAAYMSAQSAKGETATCYAHSKGVMHSNAGTECTFVPDFAHEQWGTSNVSGSIVDW